MFRQPFSRDKTNFYCMGSNTFEIKILKMNYLFKWMRRNYRYFHKQKKQIQSLQCSIAKID